MNFIPNNFYVGLRADDMGFMTTTVKEGFDKRKKTVDTWCRSWTYNPETQTRESSEGKTFEIDNEFKSGFQVMVNDRRYRTDNVVWNVKHPEGFIFQITSENFCDILQEDTLVKGVLQGEYHFIRIGTNNVLALKGSPILDKARTQAEIETKVSTTKLEVGDKVHLKSTGKSEFIYMGAFHLLPSLARGTGWRDKPDYSGEFKTVKRHVFRKVGATKFSHDIYTTLASPKVLAILEKGAEKITLEDCFEELKNSLMDFEKRSTGAFPEMATPIRLTDSTVIGISKKATKLSDMTCLRIEIPKEHVGSDVRYNFADRVLIDTSGNNAYADTDHGLKLCSLSYSGFSIHGSTEIEVKKGSYIVPTFKRGSTGYMSHWQRNIIFSRSNRGLSGTATDFKPDEPMFIQLLVGE